MRSDRSRETEKARETLLRAQQLENLATLPMYNLDQTEEIDVQIRPNPKVSLGNFKPDLLELNVYWAHPQTIRAMKKNIFTCGHDLSELEEPHCCHSCHVSFDKQFWHFCPYCGEGFKVEI